MSASEEWCLHYVGSSLAEPCLLCDVERGTLCPEGYDLRSRSFAEVGLEMEGMVIITQKMAADMLRLSV